MTKTVVIDGVEYVPKVKYALNITGVRSDYEPIYSGWNTLPKARFPVGHYMTVTNANGDEISIPIAKETLSCIMEAI